MTDLLDIRKRLGHSTIAMTLDIYGHLFPRGDGRRQLRHIAGPPLMPLMIASIDRTRLFLGNRLLRRLRRSMRRATTSLMG
jgi:hypothetical protein